MRSRWTAEARSDLVRLHACLAPMNRQVAARAVQRRQSAPARLLRNNPRLGVRLGRSESREIRRLFVDDYEMRYEIQGDTIFITNLWHTRENR